jgi:5-methylcytosine-specific restriction endonuclease McrA
MPLHNPAQPKTCLQCGVEFIDTKHKNKRCCSPKCANTYRRKAKTYTCEFCGKSFKRRGNHISHYCSKSCFDTARRKFPDTACAICGIIFQPNHTNQVCCGNECGHKYVQKKLDHKVECTCLICGKITLQSPALVTKYCSPECYWKSKFTTPHGYKKHRQAKDFRSIQRRAIKERDNYQCVKCGATNNLEIDHILAIRLGGANTIQNGQTLCHTCHAQKTERDKKKIAALKRQLQSPMQE